MQQRMITAFIRDISFYHTFKFYLTQVGPNDKYIWPDRVTRFSLF